MNNNDKKFLAERIRAQYVEKEYSELDELRALDAKVKTPANVFGYAFGAASALIMGSGMSLVMTELGTILGITASLPVGIALGVLGLGMALVNYPIYKKILSSRKQKHAAEILALSEKLMK